MLNKTDAEILTKDEKLILESIQELDISILDGLDENIIISFNYKSEFIGELKKSIDGIKSQGYQKLEVKDSLCRHCFPNYKAFEFYCLETGNLVVRYIIYQENESSIMVSKCSNKNNSWTEDLKSIRI